MTCGWRVRSAEIPRVTGRDRGEKLAKSGMPSRRAGWWSAARRLEGGAESEGWHVATAGPSSSGDGTYVVEFRTAEGDVVIQHFQEWFNPVDFGACSVKSGIIALI